MALVFGCPAVSRAEQSFAEDPWPEALWVAGPQAEARQAGELRTGEPSAATTQAGQLRIATFAAPFSRDGPGLLLRDILRRDDPQVVAAIAQIAAIRPDILILTSFDHDGRAVALQALADALRDHGLDYPHLLSRLPNSGMATGIDLDGDGRTGTARDAQGYGRFSGQGGLAILSRWGFDLSGLRDFSALLWRDLPGAILPVTPAGDPFPSVEVREVQRLSSTGHWLVPVEAPGGTVDLMVWSATPPLFDGPERRNHLRARDELLLWTRLLDGRLGAVPGPYFVIAGNANLDPADGAGDRAAMAAFLADPRLVDPRPASAGALAAADSGHLGPPELDTVDWDGPGNLRVSYILPSARWEVIGSGVFWPAPGDPQVVLMGPDGRAAGPHRLVWVDLMWSAASPP